MQEAHAVALAVEAEPVAETLPEVSTDDIARLAYRLWEERGCPIGSPEEDWLRAEELLTVIPDRR